MTAKTLAYELSLGSCHYASVDFGGTYITVELVYLVFSNQK